MKKGIITLKDKIKKIICNIDEKTSVLIVIFGLFLICFIAFHYSENSDNKKELSNQTVTNSITTNTISNMKDFMDSLNKSFSLTTKKEQIAIDTLLKENPGKTLNEQELWHYKLVNSFSEYKALIELSLEQINGIDVKTLDTKELEILGYAKDYINAKMDFANATLTAFNPANTTQNSDTIANQIKEKMNVLSEKENKYLKAH